MEGKGRSRRRRESREARRRISALLSVALTTVMTLNGPLGVLGSEAVGTFASASDARLATESNASIAGIGGISPDGGQSGPEAPDAGWMTAKNAGYAKGQTQDVDIYVIAEDNDVAPGNTSVMRLYLKNNTDSTVTDGTLSFTGSRIRKEDGAFTDISGAGAAAQDGRPDDWGAVGALEGDGIEQYIDEMEAWEAEEYAREFGKDEYGQGLTKLTGIRLEPGQLHEVAFEFYTDESVSTGKAYVDLKFQGEGEVGKVRSSERFYYSIGMPAVAVELLDGQALETGIEHELSIWMTAPSWSDYEVEEVQIPLEKTETAAAETETESKAEPETAVPEADTDGGTEAGEGSATDSGAEDMESGGAGAEGVEEAAEGTEEDGVPTGDPEAEEIVETEDSPAPAEDDVEGADGQTLERSVQELETVYAPLMRTADTVIQEPETPAEEPAETLAEEPAETLAEEPAETLAEEPAETLAEEPAETLAEEPAKTAYALSIKESKVSYTVEVFGAEFKRFRPVRTAEAEDIGWIGCRYELAEDTRPGVYYGKVTANGTWNKHSFTTSQGFLFEVTGEGTVTLKGRLEDTVVEVSGPASSFPEAQGLELLVEALSQEEQEAVREAVGEEAAAYTTFSLSLSAGGETADTRGPVTVKIGNKIITESTAQILQTQAASAAAEGEDPGAGQEPEEDQAEPEQGAQSQADLAAAAVSSRKGPGAAGKISGGASLTADGSLAAAAGKKAGAQVPEAVIAESGSAGLRLFKVDTLSVQAEEIKSEITEKGSLQMTTDGVMAIYVLTDMTRMYTADLDDVTVEVITGAGTLPEDVELVVRELREEGSDYQEAKNALDDSDVEYDGMRAFDISFIDSRGLEVEPKGNVQVSMKLRAGALPEGADLESVAVQHLAETGRGVQVEAVADSGDATEGNVEVLEAEHVEAAFEVESFSVFTVTWTDAGVTLEFVWWDDETGEEIQTTEEIKVDVVHKDSKAKYINIKIDKNGLTIAENNEASKIGTKIGESVSVPDRYAFAKKIECWTGDRSVAEEKDIKETAEYVRVCSIQKSGPDFKVGSILGKDKTETVKNGDGLVFRLCCTADRKIEIEDKIKETGNLTAKLLEPEEGYNYVYSWEKLVGEDWTAVTSDKSVSTDKASVNVAIDGGGGMQYRVKFEKWETTGTGSRKVDEGVSAPYQVLYYDHVQNGGFERPSIADYSTYEQIIPEEEPELVWKTTAGKIELVKEDRNNTYFPSHLSDGNLAQEGRQFAELNADKEGALYQDILTTPGDTLYWSLYHRARDMEYVEYLFTQITGREVKDTMYVLVMPTKKAEEHGITTQKKVKEVLKAPQKYGAYVQSYTSDSKQWHQKVGKCEIGEGQYLTRFFFVAGPTATTDETVGNLLDAISFSKDPIAIPEDQQGQLRLTKIVKGLDPAYREGYKVRLQLLQGDREIAVYDLPGEEEFGMQSDGSFGFSLPPQEVVSNISGTPYTIQVSMTEEIQNEIGTHYSGPKMYVKIDNGDPQEITDGKIEGIVVEDGRAIYIDIISVYSSGEVRFTKVLEKGWDPSGETTQAGKIEKITFQLYKSSENGERIFEEDGGPYRKVRVQDGRTNNGIDMEGDVVFTDIPFGTYILCEAEETVPAGYIPMQEMQIKVEKIDDGFAVMEIEQGKIPMPMQEKIVNRLGGAVLPDTGGPGLLQFNRFGWLLLLLALMMAGTEARYYGTVRNRAETGDGPEERRAKRM